MVFDRSPSTKCFWCMFSFRILQQEPVELRLRDMWPGGPESHSRLTNSQQVRAAQLIRGLVDRGVIAPIWQPSSPDAEHVRRKLAEFATQLSQVDFV